MCCFKFKIYLIIWALKLAYIECVQELEHNNVFNGETKVERSDNKCDENPLLTDSSRGRAITMIASSISGMNVIANIDSPQYKAACWLIHDDVRQLDPLTNSSSVALVQRYVLAVLYYSTQGWAWDNTYSFLSEKNECEWYEYDSYYDLYSGAFCDVSGNIYVIDIATNNLDGVIPWELSRLTHLEGLYLFQNKLHGILPYQLGTLENLRFISLGSNNFTGTIPEIVSRNLRLLNLYENMLTGTIPESIYKLDKLELLYLNLNMLSGKISSFSSRYLHVLALGYNQLIGTLPHNLFQLTSLESISLAENALSGTIPETILDLENLTTFNLADNNLFGSIPSALFNAPNIQVIYLNNNYLTGQIPNEVNNKSIMEKLQLRNNSFTGAIPSQLAKMEYLTELYLNNNKLSGEIPSEFSSLKNLRHLSIQYNNITGTDPFENCDQFYEFLADCDTPKKVSCDCCNHCYGLYTASESTSNHKLDCLSGEIQIDFDYTKTLLVTPNLYGLLDGALERVFFEIELTSARSSSHKCISFSDCFTLIIFPAKLPEFDISFEMSVHADGNEIIPKTTVGPSDETFTFGYSNNSISLNRCEPYRVCDVTVEPYTEKRKVLNKLIGLLNRTEIEDDSSIRSKVLCDWTKHVNSLVSNDQISYNLIQRFVLMLLYHNTNGPYWLDNTLWLSDESECLWHGVTCDEYDIIVDLNLNSNNLTGLIPSEIGELRGIESLTLSDNRIKGAIPPEIEKLENLEILIMSNNRLDQNIPIQVVNLQSLLELDLSFNTLSGNIPNNIGKLKNLIRMNLSYNFLSDHLPDEMYDLTTLISLSLSNNLFLGNVSKLSVLSQLEILELNNNFFTGNIPIDGKQKKLTFIELSRNNFMGSIPASIGKYKLLREIYLSHNELTGDIPNEIGDLSYVSRISLSFNRIKGTIPSDIRNLQNLSLLHLHGNQIKGSADYLDNPVKSYITDCGNTFTNEASVKCETCSVCCASDGDCLKVQDTWPQQDLKKLDVQPAYGLLGITFCVAIALFAICLTLKILIGKRLPRLPLSAKSRFQEGSVYKFFLVSDAKAWLVAIVTVVIQIYTLHVFIRASDFTHGMNDWQYSMSCPNNEGLCDDSRFISIHGWIIFGALIFAFLFKDLVDGLLLVYETLTTGGLKDLFAAIVVLYITSILIIASTLYNFSTSLSDTDVLKDVAILLFLGYLDEKFFEIAEHMFPTWIEQIKKNILESMEEINEELD